MQALQGIDYRTAFDLAPIGLVLSRHRLMVDCNREALAHVRRRTASSWSAARSRCCTPRPAEFQRTGERIVAELDASGRYADERVMKRMGGPSRRRTVLVPRLGPCARPAHSPHAAGIWAFEDLSARRVLKVGLHASRTRDRGAAGRRLHQQADRPPAGHQPAHGGRLSRAADAQAGCGDHGRAGQQAVGLSGVELDASPRQEMRGPGKPGRKVADMCRGQNS
jgi:hypothetical protein